MYNVESVFIPIVSFKMKIDSTLYFKSLYRRISQIIAIHRFKGLKNWLIFIKNLLTFVCLESTMNHLQVL